MTDARATDPLRQPTSKRLERLREKKARTLAKLADLDEQIIEETAKVAQRKIRVEMNRRLRAKAKSEKAILAKVRDAKAEAARMGEKIRDQRMERDRLEQEVAILGRRRDMAKKAESFRWVQVLADIVAEESTKAYGETVSADKVIRGGTRRPYTSARRVLAKILMEHHGLEAADVAAALRVTYGHAWNLGRRSLRTREDMIYRNTVARLEKSKHEQETNHPVH